MLPPHTEQVAGHTTILAAAGMVGGFAGCECAADPPKGPDRTIKPMMATIDVEEAIVMTVAA